MKGNNNILRISILVLLLNCHTNLIAQPVNNKNTTGQNHELSIYVIRSVLPLDWSSPATLFKSYKKEMRTKLFRKQKSMMGHTYVILQSPLLEKPIFAGMTYKSKNVQKKLVLNEKIGLSILGIFMEGRMQSAEEIIQKAEYYADKNEVSFIRYRINEDAARRIIEFYELYISKFDESYAKSNFYGGAFWPRYDYEGSGCSAFGFSVLELAQIPDNENDWIKSVNIPMNLIGGEINNNLKVKTREIKKTYNWHDGSGIKQDNYVPFIVYDPSSVFYWIRHQRELPSHERETGYSLIDDNGIPGLYADFSNISFDKDIPVILHREESNIFIDYFYKKTGIKQSKLQNAIPSAFSEK